MNEKPAALLADGHVVLSRKGAEMCHAALVLAHRQLKARHGGAPISDDMVWLAEVLRIATIPPERSEASAGREVAVTTSQRQEVGSEVAEPGSAGSESAAVGAGGYLDTRDAAALLGISDRAVRKACDLGKLRASRVAGHWLIEEADALAYREQRESRTDDRQAAAVG